MNPFISFDDLREILDSSILVYCASNSNLVEEYYKDSFLLIIDEITPKFINAICSVEVPESKTIICYDTGDLHFASKAYWAFRAAGFSSVKVLPRSVYSTLSIPLIQGSPPSLPRAEKPYLPFNNELAMSKEEFLKRETFYQQAVQINYLAFNILDSVGKIQSPETVLNFLTTSGIKFSQNRASIVHGKRACLGGLMMAYVSKRSVSVVIDEIESLGTPIVRDSRTREFKLSKSEDSDDVKYNTVMAGYSLTVDEVTNRTVKKSVHTRDGGTCKNCRVF